MRFICLFKNFYKMKTIFYKIKELEKCQNNFYFIFNYMFSRYFKFCVILLLLFVINIVEIFSQNYEKCSTIPAAPEALTTISITERSSNHEDLVKIYFHIYRDNNGNDGVNINRLNTMISRLNNYFIGTNISFYYNICEVRYVNDDNLYNSSNQCDFFFQGWEHSDGVDVHVKGDGENGSSIAWTSQIPGGEILIGGSDEIGRSVALTSTFPHEMGHCLGLFHTHHGIGNCETQNSITCGIEYQAGNAIDGDFVDDTPQDPGLEQHVNDDCDWDSESVCNATGTFNPLLNNIMSYSRHSCRNNFTPGQIARMHALMWPSIIHQSTLVCCNITELSPNLTGSFLTNTCPEEIVDLNTLIDGEIPNGTQLVWSQDGDPSNGISSFVSNIVETSGLYYAYYKLVGTNCYSSPSDAVYVTINPCPCIAGDDIHIYDHQTFYQNKNIPGNIIIHDGGFLEISATLRFGETKSIQVLGGGRLAVYDAILTKCDNSQFWQGIIAEENSFVYMTNSEIINAKFPITCKNNSELYLEHNKISKFETALTFQDNVTVSLFEENEFLNGNKGIDGKNCTFLDLKAEYSRNKFSNIDIGIYLFDCNADIQSNDFEDVRIGIMPVLCFGSVIIMNNNIGYRQSGIVANITGGLHVEENVIGNNNQYGDNGIKILSGKNAFVFDNEIFAQKNGILSFQNNASILNNMVDVSGYYSDGISFTGSNGYIADNLIFGAEAEAGIDAFVGTDHLIENNEVYIMNSIPFIDAGMIKLQGPTECTVKENILNAGRFSDGLLLGNSGSNLLECNEVTNARGNSINVAYNSEFQEIKTNTLTGRTDLIIKSEIGVQRDKGNEFVGGTALALGMTDVDVLGSKFYANPAYTDHLPDHLYPENWFETSSNVPEKCIFPQGPGNINIYNDPVRLCEYFNRLKVLQTTNPKLFMVKLMHILNYLKKHNKPVPDCIKIFVLRICGLDKISEVYVKLVGINSNDRENTLPLATIRENISADRIDVIKESISDYKEYYQDNYNKEMRLLDTLKIKLDSIQCPDTLIMVWKKVLLSYIDLISGDSMPTSTRTELTQVAKLCSYDYGEVVNLSRMMISEYDTSNYNVYDVCREELEYREGNSEESEEVDIYPNPTEGNLTVILPSIWESGTIEVFNMNGVLIDKKINLSDERRIEFNMSLKNGTYFIKMNSSKGDLYVRKFIVIK